MKRSYIAEVEKHKMKKEKKEKKRKKKTDDEKLILMPLQPRQ